MLEKIKDLFRWRKIDVKFAPVTTIDTAYSRMGVPKPKNEAEFADATANLAWVYIAVKTITETAAMLPLKLYSKTSKANGTAEMKEITSGFQYDLINKPAAYVTPVAFRQSMFSSYCFSGNSYLFIDMDTDSLWSLLPQEVAIVADQNKFIRNYVYRPKDLNIQVLDPSLVVHVKSFHPLNYFYGLSPLQACWDQVNFLDKDDRFWSTFWKEGGRLQGIFTADGALSSESVERLKEQIKQSYQGVSKMHAQMVVDNGLKFQQLGVSQKDAQLLEKYGLTREEVLAAFKIPPSMAGILDQANYSNMEVQKLAFYEMTILPILRLFEEALSSHPVMSNQGQIVYKFDTSDIEVLNANEKTIAETGELLIRSGQMTPNEVRERYWDMKPLADGNQLRLVNQIQNTPTGLAAPEGKKKEMILLDVPKLNHPKEPMMSMRTSDERLVIAKAFDDSLKPFDESLAKSCRAIFGKQKEIVLANCRRILKEYGRLYVRKDEINGFLEGLQSFSGDFEEALKESYNQTIPFYGQKTQSDITAMLPNDSVLTPQWNFSDPKISRFIKARSQSMAGEINKETLAIVRDEIAFLQSENANLAEISDSISALFDGMDGWRSMRIARTETAAGANEAIDTAYQQNPDIVDGREWVTANDAQVRDSHAEVSGTVVGLNEMFDVGGVQMPYPCWGGGPAEEVINCRCTTVPFIDLTKEGL